jgi:Uma2 family endonuclease
VLQTLLLGVNLTTPRRYDKLISMEQLIPPPTRITEEQYLRAEETAVERHEFRSGQMIDMAGGTSDHAAIASNLLGEIRAQLKGKPRRAFGSDLRVRTDEAGHYAYPDVFVVCGNIEYHQPEKRTTVVNPRVIIEVLSTSTETADRGIKFTDYRSIQAVQEYFLVSQLRTEVESFYRQPDGIWAFGPRYTKPDQSVKFRSLEIEIPVSEIYAGVQFHSGQVPSDPA